MTSPMSFAVVRIFLTLDFDFEKDILALLERIGSIWG